MKITQIISEELIKTDLQNLWKFISDPKNLGQITPKNMDFRIINNTNNKPMYPGMIITYSVRPILGIKLNWVSEISHLKNENYFVDEQRVGPYKMWHHQHILKETKKGVIMQDIVNYIPPYGFIGQILNKLFIKKKVEKIFEFRNKKMKEIFN